MDNNTFNRILPLIAESARAIEAMGTAVWVLLPQDDFESSTVRGCGREIQLRREEGESLDRLRLRAQITCDLLNVSGA